MTRSAVVIVVGIILALVLPFARAETIAGYWSSHRMYDEIVDRARDHPELRESAFQFLRTMAEGNAEEIAPEWPETFGVPTRLLEPMIVGDIMVRAGAFERIGRLATPDALAYLQSIDRSRFSEGELQPIAKAVPLGIYFARLGQITDRQRRWEFQVETLRHLSDGLGREGPPMMAYRALCTDGALAFLPDVETFLRQYFKSQADVYIQLCNSVMALVASHSDRVTGLATALRTKGETPDALLLRGWALQELSEMRTPESRAALDQFIKDAKARLGPDQHNNSRLAQEVRGAERALVRITTPAP